MTKNKKHIALLAFFALVLAAEAGSTFVTAAVGGKKDTICHVPSDPDETMDVPPSTVDNHLGHGDYLGACVASSSSSSSSSNTSSSSSSSSSMDSSSSAASSDKSDKKDTICHVLSDPDETMDVPPSTVDSHLGHGDYLGACVASSSSSSSLSAISSSSSSSSLSAISSSSSSSSLSAISSSFSSIYSSSQSSFSLPAQSGGGHEESHNERRTLGGSESALQPVFRGHGLSEHASVVDFILGNYDLQPQSTYTIGGSRMNTAAIASSDTADRALRENAAACSMYRYFRQLLIERPFTPDTYIDWMSQKLASTLDRDEREMKAVLLGLPNDYKHASNSLESINDMGCAANAYLYVPATETSHEAAPVHHQHSNESFPLKDAEPIVGLGVNDMSTDSHLSFAIMQGDRPFADFGNSLAHRMHLVIVRDDLEEFYHIHPQYDENNQMWTIPFTPEKGGTYWIYANFVDSQGQSYALRFERTYSGDKGNYGMAYDNVYEQDVGDYHFRIVMKNEDRGMSLRYIITDQDGSMVAPQNFMGAFGHLVILSTEGYFVHAHPSLRFNEPPAFFFETPPAGVYRAYAQFMLGDKEYTVKFDFAK